MPYLKHGKRRGNNDYCHNRHVSQLKCRRENNACSVGNVYHFTRVNKVHRRARSAKRQLKYIKPQIHQNKARRHQQASHQKSRGKVRTFRGVYVEIEYGYACPEKAGPHVYKRDYDFKSYSKAVVAVSVFKRFLLRLWCRRSLYILRCLRHFHSLPLHISFQSLQTSKAHPRES